MSDCRKASRSFRREQTPHPCARDVQGCTGGRPLTSTGYSPYRRTCRSSLERRWRERNMTQALQSRLESIDVSDPRLYQDDTWRPLFAKLRRDDPVHYCEDSAYGPYWSVTRYDDIMTVELDHQNYSSEHGGIQIIDTPESMK